MHSHSHSHDDDTVSIIDWLNDSVLDLVVGSTMLIANLTIFIVIQRRKTIEKEYSLLASLVCFNSLMGAMLIYQSYYHAMFDETEHIVHDRWSCIKHPHIVLLPATGCVMSIILPCIAFDRYLAVSHPIYYYRLDNNSAKFLAFIVTGIFVLITITLFVIGLSGPSHVHCHPLDFYTNAVNAAFMSCGWIGHLASVLLYFAVIRRLRIQHSCSVVLRECQKCTDSSHGFVSIRRMFAVFATITLILVVIPIAIMAGHEIAFMNPTISVVAYAMKHKQVYIGVRELLSRKISKTSGTSTKGIFQKLGARVSGTSV